MDYDAAKVTIAELKAKINGQAVLVGIDPLRQRKRKGESERVISDLLRNLPEGSGLRMQEVCTKTGIAYSSVFRILKSKGKGKYIEDNGLWMLAKK